MLGENTLSLDFAIKSEILQLSCGLGKVGTNNRSGLSQSEWLQSKSLQAINAGEGVEKREPSSTVGGNAN